MVQVLWNYLKGYVIIKISGFSVERFLNLMSDRNILAWDIARFKSYATMKIRVSSTEEAARCATKTGCTITVINKKGLPVALAKLKGRHILMAGLIAFVAVFYGMSLFIWTVDLTGIERTDREKLLAFCKTNGVYAGVIKKEINPKEVAENIVENFEGIAWASVEIKGAKARIKVVETLPETEIADRKTPADIVAEADGVIISIAASSGKPEVKEGDVVAKGDLLISSEIEIKENDEIKGYDYVAAEGSVIAKVTYYFSSFKEFEENKKVYTGEDFEDTAIIFGNNTFNILKPDTDGKKYDTFVSEDIKLKIGDYSLPVGIKKYNYKIYEEKEIILTKEETKAYLKADIDSKTEDITKFGAVVLDRKDTFTEEINGIRIASTVTVSEDIALKDFNIRRSTLGGIEREVAGN